MAVNLPPHYHDAEARFKKARTTEEKLVALREMWVLLPKHKASEKVQAILKTKISELTDEQEAALSGPKKAAHTVTKIPRQGAGQIALLGPPNAGKSALLARLTKATPAVAPYPFTTREPTPGMMDYADVRVQLIDLPPITADHYEPAVTDLTRAADAALLFLDLADDDGPAATIAAYDRLKRARRELVAKRDADQEDPTTYAMPTLLVANKSDDEAADIRLEMAKEAFAGHPVGALPMQLVSAETGAGCEELRKVLFETLGVMRIYTKQPGKPADKTSPFTCPVGSCVSEFAGVVHNDFEEKCKSAKVWGSGAFDGQTVGRDHILAEGDIVELVV